MQTRLDDAYNSCLMFYYEVDRKNIFRSYLGAIFIQEKLQQRGENLATFSRWSSMSPKITKSQNIINVPPPNKSVPTGKDTWN